MVLDDQLANLARRLRHANGGGDLERRRDVLGAGSAQLSDQVATRRHYPDLMATALQRAGEADDNTFQPAYAHGLRGEQNPHRPRRL